MSDLTPRTTLLVASIFGLVLAAFALGAVLARPSWAEQPRTAECEQFYFIKSPADPLKAPEAWMNQQIAAGRSQFAVWGTGAMAGLCAW